MATAIFHYRSDQTLPRLSNSRQVPTMVQIRANGTSAVALANVTSEVGVFGSQYLDMATPSVTRSPYWPGFQNTPSGAPFAILVRIIPRWTGAPAAADLVNMSGSNGNGSGRINLAMLATGAFRLNLSDADGQTAASVSTTTTYTSYTSGTAVDIFLTWDGTTGANAFSIYINGVLLQSVTAGSAMYTLPNQLTRSGIIVGNGPNAAVSNFDLNELVIFDGAQANPGVRVAFYSTSAFDASTNTSAGAANIRLANTTEVINGVSTTGSLIVPARGDVRSGTGTDNTTGLLDLPSIADVKSGVQFDQTTKTGTYVAPAGGSFPFLGP